MRRRQGMQSGGLTAQVPADGPGPRSVGSRAMVRCGEQRATNSPLNHDPPDGLSTAPVLGRAGGVWEGLLGC